MAVNTTETIEPKRGRPKKALSEMEMDRDVVNTAGALKDQPTRTVRLPRGEGLEQRPDEVVHVNGHMFQIQRGVDVEVPQTVYEILDEAGRLG